MTEIFDTDVLICGAGAAGLTLAIDLARRGVSFRLVDKLAEPFACSRGKGVQPSTQEIFEDFGILERVVAVGGVYPLQRTYKKDGYEDTPVVEGNNPTPAEPHKLALMVPQFLTERVMRERLREFGHSAGFGHELVSFEQDIKGVTAKAVGPTGDKIIRARYLIGADGGRSFVRHALNIGFPGRTLGVRGLVADMNMTGLSRDFWHRFGEGDMKRQIALCPLAGTDMFQLQAPIPLEGEVDMSADGLTRMIADRTGRTDICVHSVSWASAFSLHARLADHYRVGRVFLAGDVAHTHPPTGAQGLNTSFQDAYNPLPGSCRPYSTGLQIVSWTHMRKNGVQSRPRCSACPHRSSGPWRVVSIVAVSQLDIGYQKSSLALDVRKRRSTLRAGCRAPDAPVSELTGHSVRLSELLKGLHWTLLGNDVDRSLLPAAQNLQVHSFGAGGDLVDNRRHFRDAYQLQSGEWALIQPDGYVGAIGSTDRTGPLKSYMQSVGLTSEV